MINSQALHMSYVGAGRLGCFFEHNLKVLFYFPYLYSLFLFLISKQGLMYRGAVNTFFF